MNLVEMKSSLAESWPTIAKVWSLLCPAAVGAGAVILWLGEIWHVFLGLSVLTGLLLLTVLLALGSRRLKTTTSFDDNTLIPWRGCWNSRCSIVILIALFVVFAAITYTVYRQYKDELFDPVIIDTEAMVISEQDEKGEFQFRTIARLVDESGNKAEVVSGSDPGKIRFNVYKNSRYDWVRISKVELFIKYDSLPAIFRIEMMQETGVFKLATQLDARIPTLDPNHETKVETRLIRTSEARTQSGTIEISDNKPVAFVVSFILPKEGIYTIRPIVHFTRGPRKWESSTGASFRIAKVDPDPKKDMLKPPKEKEKGAITAIRVEVESLRAGVSRP